DLVGPGSGSDAEVHPVGEGLDRRAARRKSDRRGERKQPHGAPVGPLQHSPPIPGRYGGSRAPATGESGQGPLTRAGMSSALWLARNSMMRASASPWLQNGSSAMMASIRSRDSATATMIPPV